MFESPAGYEHIAVLNPIEGYRVCRVDGPGAWDSGKNQSAGWEPAVITQPNGRNTLPLRITRRTNGLEVVQDFFFAAPAYSAAQLTIQMKVYNRTSVIIPSVDIQRFFDADVNGDPDDDTLFETVDTIGILDSAGFDLSTDPGTRGLALAAGILDKRHAASSEPFDNFRTVFEDSGRPCNEDDPHGGGVSSVPRDYVGAVTYQVGDIAPGGVKTVSFIYRPF